MLIVGGIENRFLRKWWSVKEVTKIVVCFVIFFGGVSHKIEASFNRAAFRNSRFFAKVQVKNILSDGLEYREILFSQKNKKSGFHFTIKALIVDPKKQKATFLKRGSPKTLKMLKNGSSGFYCSQNILSKPHTSSRIYINPKGFIGITTKEKKSRQSFNTGTVIFWPNGRIGFDRTLFESKEHCLVFNSPGGKIVLAETTAVDLSNLSECLAFHSRPFGMNKISLALEVNTPSPFLLLASQKGRDSTNREIENIVLFETVGDRNIK